MGLKERSANSSAWQEKTQEKRQEKDWQIEVIYRRSNARINNYKERRKSLNK